MLRLLIRRSKKVLLFILVSFVLIYLMLNQFTLNKSRLQLSNIQSVTTTSKNIVQHSYRHSSIPNKNDYTETIIDDHPGVVIYKRTFIDELIQQKENATLFTLARNSDLYGLLKTIRNFEDRFNYKYHYDWTFANEESFSPEFIKLVSNMCSGTVKFLTIPPEMWTYPDFIDQQKAADVRSYMKRKRIKYGDSEPYRHMCRFFSGFFFQLDEMLTYKYVWRIEPDIEYRCDINYDPFKTMRKEDKVYGFNLAPLELHTTVKSLWESTLEYMDTYKDRISSNNNFLFLTDDNGKKFNMCHFWSNFEIADMDFYRSDAYQHFFQFLDLKGGIYYERWGDAPIHTIAVSILLPYNKLKYFGTTGYYHSPNLQCDGSLEMLMENRCICDNTNDFAWSDSSCIPKFFDIHSHDLKRPAYAPTFKYIPIHDKKLRRLELEKEKLKKSNASPEQIEDIMNVKEAEGTTSEQTPQDESSNNDGNDEQEQQQAEGK